MNFRIKQLVLVLLVGILLIYSAASGFAAEVRRVPSKASVEQGFLALTLDAEGAEDFRYTGLEDKTHMYRGTIKPESKLKFSIKATLADQKSLPITGRSCIMRLQVVAKKGGEVIKTQNFSKENKSNVFVNYTVPQGTDTLEVTETFVLSNKSKEQKFNQRVTSQNKLILTTSAAGAGVANNKTGDSGNKKSDTGSNKNSDKKDNVKTDGSDKSGGADTGKADAKDSKGSGKGMLAGAVVAVAAIAGGGYFFLKKRKEDQAVNDEIARKEKLRQQAIMRQQELQQNHQSQQDEINQHDRMLEEQRMREEEARQQELQREQQQSETLQQNAMQAQNELQQNANTVAAAGAVGAMSGTQNNVTENASESVPDTAPHFCENCGAPLKPGSKFCENCGTKL